MVDSVVGCGSNEVNALFLGEQQSGRRPFTGQRGEGTNDAPCLSIIH